MTESVLEFTNLYKGFDGMEVLKGISGQVTAGEVIGVLGLNGAGKTTLIETVLGFSFPDKGECKLFGHNSANLQDKATKTRVGFVPQQDELMETLNPKQYLELIAAFYDHWNWELINRLCIEWDIPMLRKIQKLSLGQRQKISILSALGHEPDLIILDEPVASLDPVARRKFLQELVNIASNQKCSIIFSTHIVSDLERIASRVWLMKDGHLSIDEALDALKENTVKIHLPPGVPVPDGIKDYKLIHSRLEQKTNVLLFGQWSDGVHQKLESLVGCSLTPEWLSLEDIFLELHIDKSVAVRSVGL